MAETQDEMSDLLPFKWRDVQVPVRRIGMSFAHDLVLHKPWNTPAARVENTGTAPKRFTVTVAFINTIAPGPNENWSHTPLYPYGLRKFFEAFEDRSSGLLQHPEYGLYLCKAEQGEFELTAESRSGVEITCSFVETTDADFEERDARPLDLTATAIDFDTQQIDLKAIVPQLPEYKTTFADLARQIAGVGDQISILSYRTAGRVNSIKYHASKIGQSIDRAKSALTWPAKRNVERITSAANDSQRKILDAAKDIGLYRVPNDTTLAGLLTALPGSKVSDIVRLNPRLVAKAVIRENTIVRYISKVI